MFSEQMVGMFGERPNTYKLYPGASEGISLEGTEREVPERARDITELRLSFSGRPIKSFHLLASWVKDTSRWFSMLIIQTNIYTYYKMNKVDDSPITLFL